LRNSKVHWKCLRDPLCTTLCVRRIQSKSSHSISMAFFWITTFHLRLDLPSGLLSSGLTIIIKCKVFMCLSYYSMKTI
jgi:uncharacterized protein with PQ loop repeat